jgi:hypothetical protein
MRRSDRSVRRDRGSLSWRAATFGALTLVAATGICSTAGAVTISIGGGVLDNVNSTVAYGLYQAVGQHPVSVSCPSDVPAKVGHKFQCKVVINAKHQYVIATVTETSVNGSRVHLQISDGTTIYSGK